MMGPAGISRTHHALWNHDLPCARMGRDGTACGSISSRSALVDLYSRCLHDLRPFADFRLQEITELLRRGRHDADASFGEGIFNARRHQHLVDPRVEPTAHRDRDVML